MKPSTLPPPKKEKPKKPSKLNMKFNPEKKEVAISAQGWVTFFIALLGALLLFAIWKTH